MTEPALAIPQSWGGSRGLPGAVVRTVRGFNVHNLNGADYLSPSTVLRIMRFGELDPDAEPAAVAYGTQRGIWVGDAVRLWEEAGRPDVAPFAAAMDAQTAAWREPRRNWRRFTVAPYLAAYAQFCDEQSFDCEAAEVLMVNEELRTFGYADVVGTWGADVPVAIEVKTPLDITHAHRWQAASYERNEDEQSAVVQLRKDGTYALEATTDAERERWCELTALAHLFVQEQEQLAAARAARKGGR